jgi:hypothetical protein
MATAGYMANDNDQKQKPGRKLFVDVKKHTCQLSDLTIDEARAITADVKARLAALERRWTSSGDLQALLGGLFFCQRQLPPWLFNGLVQNIRQQFNNPDAERFLAVRYAHDELGMTVDEAYDWASDHLAGPKVGRDAIMKSYQKIRRQVAAIDRIRPRSPRRRPR